MYETLFSSMEKNLMSGLSAMPSVLLGLFMSEQDFFDLPDADDGNSLDALWIFTSAFVVAMLWYV